MLIFFAQLAICSFAREIRRNRMNNNSTLDIFKYLNKNTCFTINAICINDKSAQGNVSVFRGGTSIKRDRVSEVHPEQVPLTAVLLPSKMSLYLPSYCEFIEAS